MSRALAWAVVAAGSGGDRCAKEIQRFPMLDPQQEYLLAKRWREDGDREAGHRPRRVAICSWSPRSPGAIAAYSLTSPST